MLSRISSLALAFLMATVSASNPFEAKQSSATAKSAYMNKLMRGAVETENSQLRRLDEEYEIDISGYSMKFQKCQFVKQYEDELAEEEEAETVLGTKRFVVFRLCPSNTCESSCNYGYGEYIVDMDEYLEATINYAEEQQEEMCQMCDEDCQYYGYQNQGDEAEQDNGERRLDFRRTASDCSSCVDTCQKIENMEENGYVDATEFVNCVEIRDEGDDGSALFAGAMCAGSGQKIKIGVFSDEECMFLEENLDVEDYLADGDGGQIKLSHALLRATYEETCISCLVVDEEEEQQNYYNDKEPEVTEVCEQLYEASAKCEKKHGFDNGYANYAAYANQLANEEVVCDYIDAIEKGTYEQGGEIAISGATSYSNGTATTGGQKFFLTFFILGTVGLAVYAAMLHTSLTKSAKADLSSQGGAMA
eukprot:CAMPEP_0184857478 /NCGR_PEP_ID=MMETSP0580-20130426/2627_1 /TAXON_ID=1118495 /ORGANISM="Dactyliosolen fragilissimus" /LENGTH=419 /DNA_ID=CAMNT_0027353095 /DNA_START=102 /DNA_END=1361 /DNA_ORIENTATION=+